MINDILEMFTGIVESLCEVKSIKYLKNNIPKSSPEIKLTIDLKGLGKGLKIGQSICVNGTCLTITNLRNGIAEFELVGETVKRTCLNLIKKGDKTNIERSMRASGRFDGHFVQGHVDCIGIIHDKIIFPTETKIVIEIPEEKKEMLSFIVSKGSIAIDGISLTVVDVTGLLFSISLIPHTLKNTTLGIKSIGDPVNIEFDIVGKYISKLLPKN
ncbi:MAG TPA: riboflavin synthase [Nitrososphaeraceae archaeon]|nr:riboflavin synthase [Nitrososphaeraceae archaeon]